MEVTLTSIIISIIFSAVASGTVVLFATIGEIITERSGVLNLGIEGMLLMGACIGFFSALYLNSMFLAIIIAALVGGAMATIHAFVSITLRANQVVSGLALTILGTGLSSFFGKNLVGRTLSVHFSEIKIPLLSKIPIIGPIFFSHTILVYVAYIATILVWFVLKKTKWGLAIRSCGEEPLASEIMGIKVTKVRYLSTITGGMFSGIAGAYLSLSYTPLWVDGMTAGRGWIAVALVIFSNWNPLTAFGGAIIFGGLEAFQLRLQALGFNVPAFLLSTIPYIFTILFLLIVELRGARSSLPKALGNSYFRESRG